MPTTAKDPDQLIDEIIPAQEMEKLEAGRMAEIIQPLRDLGYLPTGSEVALAEGIRLFRMDYLSLNLIPEFSPRFLLQPATAVESEELNLLHTLTAMDGDYTIKVLPNPGEINLFTRLIHYRLLIHELINFPVEQPMSKATLEAIHRPTSWINNLPKDTLSLINFLGNIPDFIRHVAKNKNGQLDRKVVVFRFLKSSATLSAFAPLPQLETMAELTETSDDVDPVDQEEAKTIEREMQQLDTEIDQELAAIQQIAFFKNKEQQLIAADIQKHKKSRAKSQKVAQMLDTTLAELNSINDEFNEKSKRLRVELARLKELRISLEKEFDTLRQDFTTKQTLLKSQENIDSDISKKQKEVQRIKSKKQTPKRKKKIAALLQEIQQLQANRLSSAKMQNLEFAASDVNVRMITLEAELQPMKKKEDQLQKSFDQHVDNLPQLLSDKQKDILQIQQQLKALQLKIHRLKFSFRSRMRRSLADDYYEEVVRREIFQKRNRQLLENFSVDAYNLYLIRLIQIFQWINGYYYGKIDGEVGNRTFSALDDMSDYSRKLRLKFILHKLSDQHDGSRGFWILNVKYLFAQLDEIIADQSKEVTTSELLEKYEKEFQQGDKDKMRIGNEAMDRGYREMVKENQKDLQQAGKIRRIYYGVRSIARTLFNTFKELVLLLKRGIKRLIYLAKNLIKIVYKEIREGVRKFREGMHFLFGHRIFQTMTQNKQAIYTKFDFDFDAQSYIPEQTSRLEKIQHIEQLYRATGNLDFSLTLTARVLKWTFRIIEAGTPIGWAKLAIRIAIQYRKLMIRWLINLGKFFVGSVLQINYRPAV